EQFEPYNRVVAAGVNIMNPSVSRAFGSATVLLDRGKVTDMHHNCSIPFERPYGCFATEWDDSVGGSSGGLVVELPDNGFYGEFWAVGINQGQRNDGCGIPGDDTSGSNRNRQGSRWCLDNTKTHFTDQPYENGWVEQPPSVEPNELDGNGVEFTTWVNGGPGTWDYALCPVEHVAIGIIAEYRQPTQRLGNFGVVCHPY